MEISKIRKVTSSQCQKKMTYLKDHYKEARYHNRNQTGGDMKSMPLYQEIDAVLGCRDIVTFSHVEESSPSASSWQGNEQKDDEERNLDDDFEKSLPTEG